MNRFLRAIALPFKKIGKWIIGSVIHNPYVTLDFSSEPYFVGSYAKIKVKATNITFDELSFNIIEGAPGGYISHCRDAEFDPGNPDIMVCFGYQPGKYHLEVRKRADNSLINTFDFSVGLRWADEKRGPGLSFTGIAENISFNPAWGGGPSTPQNFNVIPATGTRRIAIILIDFSDARYPTDTPTLDGIRNRWMDEVINGVNNSGRLESSRAWFREVSYNKYDISASVFGPVNLPDGWDTYFHRTLAGAPNGAPKGTFWQQAVTGCDDTVNYNDFDNLIFVSESFTDSAGGMHYAWPYGGAGTFSTAEGNKNLGVISMPREWGASFRPNRTVRATVIHELGHSIGLGDQYKPVVTGRNPGNWEPMATEDRLPHYSLAHRMMLGWMEESWIKTFNFANGGGGVVDETVTLSPIERAATAGQKSGIEVRVADGLNYYIEYRSPQTTQIGDRVLDVSNAVLVTDVDSSPQDAPISRPFILLVPNDSDADGSVLINGRDYEATDSTDPTFPTDFKLSVDGITADKADITIQYGINSKPDPAIRPWPASAERQWQSPDIEVRNARNLADPANWYNVPWAGHSNTIVATVTNNGNLAAPGVKVEFYVKNYNVGGAPETYLATDTKDIPANGAVEFTAEWNPPGNGHYCVVVKIPGYMTPPPNPTMEGNIFNNLAQSNYDKFISATASPAARKTAFFEVGNPYDQPTMIYIRPGQTNPLYRTYLEYTHVYLKPGETSKVKLMFEFDPQYIYRIPVSLGKTKHIDVQENSMDKEKVRLVIDKYHSKPNRVGVVAYIDNPWAKHPETPARLGGLEAEIITGKKTYFERFYKDGNFVGGSVRKVEDKGAVTTGSVILIMEISQDGKVHKEDLTIPLNSSGAFQQNTMTNKIGTLLSVQAYYLPGPGMADCYSEIKR